MDPATMSVDQLIAASAEFDDRAYRVFDRLAGITARARGEHGIEVEVTVDGMITAVELTAAALRLAPDQLAAELYRLTHEASASALAEGVAILRPVAAQPLLDLLDPPEPAVAAGAGDVNGDIDGDFAAVRTWALPR